MQSHHSALKIPVLVVVCHPFISGCIVVMQKEPSGEVCVPVLSRRWRDAALPQETVRYLQRLKICEDRLVWREDVDLVKLHHAKRLSLTLLREGLLHRYTYAMQIRSKRMRQITKAHSFRDV